MKVTQQHLDIIREAIAPFDTEANRDRYRKRDIPRGETVKDIDTRFRWDLYWAGARAHGSMPDSTNGYTTAHLDTALRRLVPAL